MILSSETNPADAQQMLEFYKQHFAVVELVSCSQCGSMLAFECQGGDTMGLPVNELGKVIIPIGDNLLSSRVRLDEAPTGERMMGYQCGHPVPNPVYPAAMKKYEEDLAAFEAEHQKTVKAIEAEYQRQLKKKKKDDPDPIKQEVTYTPPMKPNVPEFIPCDNDTRIADIERGHVPVGPMQVTLSPFEKHNIREKIFADKSYKPNFRKVGNIKHFESFQVERL